MESLQENAVDFALVSVIPQNLTLEYISLMPNKLYLIGATNYHRLPKKMKITDLNTHTLIFREHGSATRNAMISYLNKNQIKVKRSMQLTSNEAVKQAVRAGLGLSIMPYIGIRSELALHNMAIIPIKSLPIITQWNLVYRSGKKLSPVAEALIAFIENQKSESLSYISKKIFQLDHWPRKSNN